MRVVINAMAAAGERTGIGHYIAELIRALSGIGGVTVSSYPNPPLARFRERLGGGRPPGSNGTGGPPASDPRWSLRHIVRTPLRLAWRGVTAAHARSAFSPRNADLYHEPNFFPRRTRLPTIVTVHDLSAVHHPEWHPADRVRQFETMFLPRVSQFNHILTGSDAVRDEVIATLGVPPERVTRAYYGVRSNLRPLIRAEVAPVLRRLELPSDYLLHVGTLEPRKNLLMLLRAYIALPADLRDRCPLVLVGQWGWRVDELAEFYEAEAKYKNVRRLGYVAEADLAALYNGARALVFPTLYEGFGLPAAEMLACGGAVIASATPALEEVLGPCGATFPPTAAAAWHDALRRAIVEPDWVATLRTGAIDRAVEFTWEQCARDTRRAYGMAVGSKRTR